VSIKIRSTLDGRWRSVLDSSEWRLECGTPIDQILDNHGMALLERIR